MINVRFYENGEIPDEKMTFVVISARFQGKWIMAKHNERDTWEIPGGHVENGESVIQAAKRELFEETGAINAQVERVCVYSVKRDNAEESFGYLCFAEVSQIGDLPESEIEKIDFFDSLPEKITYPQIQPKLHEKVLEWLEMRGDNGKIS